MLYKTGVDLSLRLKEYINTADSLYIYVPYIKLDTLKKLIENIEVVQAVIVRWELKDLVLGISDLEIYPYLKRRGIALYRNKRIHLKAFVNSNKKCFLGSANISQRALNLPESENYNFEIATIVDNLSFEDRLYFNLIESESILITNNIYSQLKIQLLNKKELFPNEPDFDIKFEISDKNFLISSLPLSFSVEMLYMIYISKQSKDEVDLNCAIHDLCLYKVPINLTKEEFYQHLKEKFFKHPFIVSFLNNLEAKGEIYFGSAKDWIYKNCIDVPLPRRWEITENIQILYRWIVTLGEGQFEVDRPNYSERLRMNIKRL